LERIRGTDAPRLVAEFLFDLPGHGRLIRRLRPLCAALRRCPG
jgi:hypothetical protein